MKKKRKVKYSLTAAQRKEKRDKEKRTIKALKDKPAEMLTTDETKILSDDTAKRQRKKTIFIRLTAIITASVLACVSLGFGIWFIVKGVQKDQSELGNPVATIKLNNGDKITVELDYRELSTGDARRHVANFIYLAKNGFYNNTTFLRASGDGGFITMAGFEVKNESYFKTNYISAQYKGRNEDYVSKLKGFKDIHVSQWGAEEYKLGYRLPDVNTLQSQISNPGDSFTYKMFMLTGTGTPTITPSESISNYATSTTFGFVINDSPQFYSNLNSHVSFMSFKVDATSQAVLNKIYGATQRAKDEYNDTYWTYSDQYLNELKISSVSISNLSRKLNKNIMDHFEVFVIHSKNNEDGSSTEFKGSLNPTSSLQTFKKKAHGYCA